MRKLAALATLAAPLIVAPLIAAPALAERCKHGADRTADVAGGMISKVVIGAGAGDLVVRGMQGAGAVHATGQACASSQKLLDEIRIDSRREGDTVYIRTILPKPSASLFLFSRYAYLDMTVSVPASAAVSVEDSSGDLRLSGVRAAVVADSSGDQSIRAIAGDLDVTDSSGDLGIENVAGNLRIKDSSGDVNADDIRGDVEVRVDSSGDLQIDRVGGSVHVNNDSSGDIEIRDVRRDVTIDSDSSGGIRVKDVGGNFTVRADGSGSINHERVSGEVRLPQED